MKPQLNSRHVSISLHAFGVPIPSQPPAETRQTWATVTKEKHTMFEYLKIWLQLRTDGRGITALEYAAIAGVLVAVVVTAATTLGGDISNTLVNSGNNL